MTIDALICDVDGTLADTEESHRIAFNLAFEGHGLGWCWSRADYRALLDVTGGKERIAAFIERLPISARERRQFIELVPQVHADKNAHYAALVADGAVPLREGVGRLLEEGLAAGCQLAIASTTTAANVDALLSSAFGPGGLHMFTAIACGDQVRAKKPAPDIYRCVLAVLDLAPERAIAFEDSVNGLRAATAAGLWTLVTPTWWTQHGDFGAAGLVLPRLGDPDAPLHDEPGHLLERGAWLTFDELCRVSRPARLPSTLEAMYRGLA
jgi:beta-phosphoglucomutase-like phosphatase (HAD superfamily)